MMTSRPLALLFLWAAASPAPAVAPIPWQLTAAPLVAALLVMLAIVGLVWQLRGAERQLIQALGAQNKEATAREKRLRDDLSLCKADLREDIDSLRAALAQIPGDTDRLIAPKLSKQNQHLAPPPASSQQSAGMYDDVYENSAQDGIAQLLIAANRIVQENSTTLEKFRQRVARVSSRVSSFGPSTGDAPVAFIVEHEGSSYAVPNVVKPARLPNDWFNRGDFGVNDEIRRVVSLPRLRRRGDRYDIEERGVFER